jgi:hypothetical protein
LDGLRFLILYASVKICFGCWKNDGVRMEN